MFFDEKLTVKTSRYGGETGKRKDQEPENLVVLTFSGVGSADLLAHISPSMRSRLYTNDDSPDMVGGKGPTKLAIPEIDNKFRVKDKVVGAEIAISYGIGSDITIGGCDVYAMQGELMEGGNVAFSFKVRTKEATARDVGIIHEVLNGREVDIVLTKPSSPQSEMEV